jgi:lipopolysaccharide/colanic/teichoic acid biosynthesis glycosyltransferase
MVSQTYFTHAIPTYRNKQQAQAGLKRLLDYAIVIPALFLIWPIFLALAIAVKLDSPGPIFYRRRVLGLDGRVFYAYKFRTMHLNGDDILARYPELQAELKATCKIKNDPRITRVGQLMRKSSLDELPQLLNVLNQEMSLIGPRMITPEEIEKYGAYGPELVTVMPGITGLWQVSGRSDTTYEQRVQLDMTYIRTWSIFLDIKILFSTIPAVLKGAGAY